jgi:hypothetical protein
MSIKVASFVWEHSAQKGAALLLLLALADHANDDGICWPSIKRLAERARVTERHAKRIVNTLVESGEVEIEQGGGRGRTTTYRVICLKGDTHVTHSKKGDISSIKGDIYDKKVTPMSEKGDTHVTPTIKNHHKEPSKEPLGDEPDLLRFMPIHLKVPELLNAWGEWCEYQKGRGKPITLPTAKRQYKQFEKWGIEQSIAAMDNSIGNNWTSPILPKSDNGQSNEPAGFAAIREVMEEQND